jgi:hypothetical protein
MFASATINHIRIDLPGGFIENVGAQTLLQFEVASRAATGALICSRRAYRCTEHRAISRIRQGYAISDF